MPILTYEDALAKVLPEVGLLQVWSDEHKCKPPVFWEMSDEKLLQALPIGARYTCTCGKLYELRGVRGDRAAWTFIVKRGFKRRSNTTTAVYVMISMLPALAFIIFFFGVAAAASIHPLVWVLLGAALFLGLTVARYLYCNYEYSPSRLEEFGERVRFYGVSRTLQALERGPHESLWAVQ